MFSEGQSATAVLYFDTETPEPRREIGGVGGGRESSTNEVSHSQPSHSYVASQQLQVADHYHAFPDTTVSCGIIILRLQMTPAWHM